MITFNEFIQLKENTDAIEAGREWLKTLTFSDFDCPEDLEEHVDSLTPMQVQRMVNAHYDGGWEGFLASM